MSVDPETLATLQKQTRRRHPEWFDLRFHPEPTERDLKKVKDAAEAEDVVERMMELAAKVA